MAYIAPIKYIIVIISKCIQSGLPCNVRVMECMNHRKKFAADSGSVNPAASLSLNNNNTSHIVSQ